MKEMEQMGPKEKQIMKRPKKRKLNQVELKAQEMFQNQLLFQKLKFKALSRSLYSKRNSRIVRHFQLLLKMDVKKRQIRIRSLNTSRENIRSFANILTEGIVHVLESGFPNWNWSVWFTKLPWWRTKKKSQLCPGLKTMYISAFNIHIIFSFMNTWFRNRYLFPKHFYI